MRKFVWQDDAASEHCTICRREFNFFNRRHHCRECGTLVCDGCSNQRAEMWDAEKRWYSPQRVCDPCAQRRSGEVVIGTRALGSTSHPFGRPASDTTSNSGGTEDSARSLEVVLEASVIQITVHAVTNLVLARPSALWGGPASGKKPWHLCCALSVDGKPLGATTVKKWVAPADSTSQGKVSEKLGKTTNEDLAADTALEWNESFSFRLGAVRPFKAAEYVIVELKDKRASGVLSGSSDDTVAYLRLPVSGLSPGEGRKGWCSLLGPVPHAPPTDGSLAPLVPPAETSVNNTDASRDANPLPPPVLPAGTGPVRPFVSSISASAAELYGTSTNSQGGAGSGSGSSSGAGSSSGYTGEYIRRTAPQRRSLRGRLWVEVRCEPPSAAATSPPTIPSWTTAVKPGKADAGVTTATATAETVPESLPTGDKEGPLSSTLPPAAVAGDDDASAAPTNQSKMGTSLNEQEEEEEAEKKKKALSPASEAKATVTVVTSTAIPAVPAATDVTLDAEQSTKALHRRRPRPQLEAWGLLRADARYPTTPLPANGHLPWTWSLPSCTASITGSSVEQSLSPSISVHRNQRGRLLGFHLGPLRLWYPSSHHLHKSLFRRVGPLPEDLVPRHEHALEVVPFVQLRLHAASRGASLSSGCLVLTTHRVLYFPEDYASEHARQRNYAEASKGDDNNGSSRGNSSKEYSSRRSSKKRGRKKETIYAQPLSVPLAAVAGTILRRRWRDIQEQTALELICIDARHFVFVFQGSDAAAAVARVSDGVIAQTAETAASKSTASNSNPSAGTATTTATQVAEKKAVGMATEAEQESEMATSDNAYDNLGSIDAGFIRDGSTSRQSAFREPLAGSHAREETAEWWGYEGERRLAWVQEQVQWLVEEDAFADGANPKHIALRDDFSDEEDDGDAKRSITSSSLQSNLEPGADLNGQVAGIQGGNEGIDQNLSGTGEVHVGITSTVEPHRRRFGSLGGFDGDNNFNSSRNDAHDTSSSRKALQAELNAESDPPVLHREALAEAVGFDPPTSAVPSSSDDATISTPAASEGTSSPTRSKSAARQAVRSSFAVASTAATALSKFRRRRSTSATATAAAAAAKVAEVAATTESVAAPEVLDVPADNASSELRSATEFPARSDEDVGTADEDATEIGAGSVPEAESVDGGAAIDITKDSETRAANVAAIVDSAPYVADPLPDLDPPSSSSRSVSVPRAGLPSHGRILMRARPGAKVPGGARPNPTKGAAPTKPAVATATPAPASFTTAYSPPLNGEVKATDEDETPSKSQPLFLSPSAPALTTWEVLSPSPNVAPPSPCPPPAWWRVLDEQARLTAATAATVNTVALSSPTTHASSCDRQADLNMLAELKRLGIEASSGWATNTQWRITHRNQNFGLCPTYPRLLVVPAALAPKKTSNIDAAETNSSSALTAETAGGAVSDKVEAAPDASAVGTDVAASVSANLPPPPQQQPSRPSRPPPPSSLGDLLTDSFLDTAAPWRSLRRLPVLTWLNPRTGAPLLRCSQPKVGFAGGACPEDEALLMALRPATQPPSASKLQPSYDGTAQRRNDAGLHGQTPSSLGAVASADNSSALLASPSSEHEHQTLPRVRSDVMHSDQIASQHGIYVDKAASHLHSEAPPLSCMLRIIDARPLLNAKANAAMGKGHESIPRLGGDALASLTFANIANIHAMRESHVVLRSACALAAACRVAWSAPQNLTRSYMDVSSNGSSTAASSSSSVEDGSRVADNADEVHRGGDHFSEQRSDDTLLNGALPKEALRRKESERETITDKVVDSTLSAVATGSEIVLGTAAAAATALVKPTNAVTVNTAAAGSASGPKSSSSSSSSSSSNVHGAFSGSQPQMTSPHLGAPYWFLGVVDSKWFNHLSAVLLAARLVATHSEQGDPVVVHCSDGWDRTAQVVSLAQFLLDPYYRTIEGFQVLVEKDWSAFGHQFGHRCHGGGSGSGGGLHKEGSGGGGGKEGGGGDEAGPVFVQWLDCVWQVLQQFPTSVEFSADLLLLLADASYSRCWSNFRDSSEAERAHSLAAQVDADAAARAVFEEGGDEVAENGANNSSSTGHESNDKISDDCSSTNVNSSCSANLPPIGGGSAQRNQAEQTRKNEGSGCFSSHRASLWEHVAYCKASFTNVLYRPPPGMATDHSNGVTAFGASKCSSGSSNSSGIGSSYDRTSGANSNGHVLWPNPTVGALELWHALHVGGSGGPLQPTPSREDLLAEAAQKQAKRASALQALLVEKGLGDEMAQLLDGLQGSDDEQDSSWKT